MGFIKYPDRFKSSSHSLTLNSSKNELYLFGSKGNLLRIDLHTMKSTKCKELQCFDKYPCVICIDDQFHVIGANNGSTNYRTRQQSATYHRVYIAGTNIFDKIHEFPRNFNHEKIFYSTTTQMLYLFGTIFSSFCLWRCNMTTGNEYKWDKHPVILMSNKGVKGDITLVCDETYAMIVRDWGDDKGSIGSLPSEDIFQDFPRDVSICTHH